MRLSAVIITFNEERNIRRCLESLVDVSDEIIVVDSYSTDATEKICNEFQVTFIQHPFEGHIQQKNYALQQANGDYILSLDADEALTPALKESILKVKFSKNPKAGYTMNRLTNYCGHWVRHGGWYPDRKLRLIENGKGEWTGVNPHDILSLRDKVEPEWLPGDLLHYSYYTADDHYRQIEFFGKIAAKELNEKGRKTNRFEIAMKCAAQWIKCFVLKSGWRDGKTGWVIARRSAFATYRKYSILREMQ